jgi:hypothetical protein
MKSTPFGDVKSGRSLPAFRSKLLPPLSVSKSKPNNKASKQATIKHFFVVKRFEEYSSDMYFTYNIMAPSLVSSPAS